MATRSKSKSKSSNRAGGRTQRRGGAKSPKRTTSRSASRSAPSASSKSRRTSRGGKKKSEAETIDLEMDRVRDLLLQAVETETGGVQIYEAAIECALEDELREEWEKYRDQTEHHVEVIRRACEELGIDPDEETPGRALLRAHAEAMVSTMREAANGDDSAGAQIYAAECVVHAETKDHQNWELIGEVARKVADEDTREALSRAHDEIEGEEDEHLYHSMGWARELWLQSLGMEAMIPPPEEEEDVSSMAEEARVSEERKQS